MYHTDTHRDYMRVCAKPDRKVFYPPYNMLQVRTRLSKHQAVKIAAADIMLPIPKLYCLSCIVFTSWHDK